ncbi:MAG: YggT family protein [Propionibacteriales bacterium]|nr:YggT family protein [Propionibacteriales bacterium]
MILVGSIIELVLWTYFLFLCTRIVADWVQVFARSWQPGGPTLVGLEIVYSATDPPIRMFRRLVPPLRLGAASIDLSILFVFLICYLLRVMNGRILLSG